MSNTPIGIGVEIDIRDVERAFDLLGAAAPRAVARELGLLATEVKVNAERDAPGSLKSGWDVVELHDSIDVSPVVGFVVGVADKPAHGDKPVARWTNYGTGDKADKRTIRDGNVDYPGQRAQRFLRRVPRKRQAEVIHKALMREARRAGFIVREVV